ncbi:MAG: ROK family protein [Dehalococcoidales bacterium]|nr:ROK family protein [Dehalococcoidales bacterium]
MGVDLGGSKILSAVVDAHGKILASDYRPTQAEEGINAVVNNILKSARAATEKSQIPLAQIAAIGLGAPGISNPETGIIYRSPNLPDWHHVPLRDIVANALKKKVFLINDANAAALGEMEYGVAKGCRNFIYITISTGIGGGIIIDGELYTGATGMAGEVGHIVVEPDGMPCNCGGVGCWELYASGSAIARRAREKIQQGRKTRLLKIAGGDLDKIDALLIKKAAEQGDALARKLVAETARYLGIGLGSLINIFNPELIVFGGGLSKMGDALLEPAIREAGRRSYHDAYKVVKFALAELGDNSGVLGAAVYARNELKKLKKAG